MTTQYEQNKQVLVNMRVSRAWRDHVHARAQEQGMNLTTYIKHLVEQDIDTNEQTGKDKS